MVARSCYRDSEDRYVLPRFLCLCSLQPTLQQRLVRPRAVYISFARILIALISMKFARGVIITTNRLHDYISDEIGTRTRGWIRFRRHQHNRRWLWTTGSERRTSFITVDNTGGETTVCSDDNSCGLAPRSHRRPY